MHITQAFKNKTLVITGGTGSFGSTVLKHFLTTDIGEIRIISRDEKKQDWMRHTLQAQYPYVRSELRVPCCGAEGSALMRVLPDGGGQNEHHRN